MSDLMSWFYTHYIKSYVECQPKDELEEVWFDRVDNDLCPHQKEDLQPLLAFYAVQGFRLGLKTGLSLGKDLE